MWTETEVLVLIFFAFGGLFVLIGAVIGVGGFILLSLAAIVVVIFKGIYDLLIAPFVFMFENKTFNLFRYYKEVYFEELKKELECDTFREYIKRLLFE